MKRVAYGGESFITSDEASEVLLEFAAAAAMSGVAEVVLVPSVDDSGAVLEVQLVIGPSSDVLITPVDSDFDDPDTRAETAVIRARISELSMTSSHTQGGAIAEPDLTTIDPDTLG